MLQRTVAEDSVDDTTLIHRFVDGGQESAFADLMYRHWPMVFRLAYGVLQSNDDAEDAAQDAFVSAARSLVSTFRFGEPIAPWLARIALNKAVDRIGQRSRWVRSGGGTGTNAHREDGQRQAEAALQAMDDRHRLHAAIRGLSEKNQAVLIYRVLMECSVRETALALGWSEAKVKTQLHRALSALREDLQDSDDA